MQCDDFGRQADFQRSTVAMQPFCPVVAQAFAVQQLGTPGIATAAVGPQAGVERAVIEQFAVLPAGHAAELGIGIEKNAGRDRGQRDRDRTGIEGHRKALLQFVQLRDVASDAENADQAAFGIAHRRLDRVQHFAMAVARESHPFLVAARPVREQCGLVVGAEEAGQFRIDEIEIGLAQDVVFAGAEKLLETPVATQIDAVRVLQPDQVGQRVEQRAQLRVFLDDLLHGRDCLVLGVEFASLLRGDRT